MVSESTVSTNAHIALTAVILKGFVVAWTVADSHASSKHLTNSTLADLLEWDNSMVLVHLEPVMGSHTWITLPLEAVQAEESGLGLLITHITSLGLIHTALFVSHHFAKFKVVRKLPATLFGDVNFLSALRAGKCSLPGVLGLGCLYPLVKAVLTVAMLTGEDFRLGVYLMTDAARHQMVHKAIQLLAHRHGYCWSGFDRTECDGQKVL